MLTTFAVLLLVLTIAVALDARVAGWAVHWRQPALDMVVGILNPIGSGVTLLVTCLSLGLLGHWRTRSRLRDTAWVGALGFAGAGLVEFAVKHLVGRARPDGAPHGILLTGPTFAPDLDSFPSGHATSVFAVAAVFAACYPRLAWPLYLLATAIAVGRVYLARHYVSDIMAGATIGIAVAWLLLGHPHVRHRLAAHDLRR